MTDTNSSQTKHCEKVIVGGPPVEEINAKTFCIAA
ncbi:predicted protein [Sclerotinia sclerotiorum 1980 UF-70]|uniref:Uncharacterized protein n=1 Tax=Sclerotinia sclerotiorum (strain ATCC 18683 / 1980 / Ss-1) TaxID=665079 RepID=A7EXE2_SCLS1|nr:predicted protein [Sclerotinia sclerotiorum 1980 UF-70]EDN94134.1 predicted protein [Sclerotinia sclerotiorum 1980 UF-70]